MNRLIWRRALALLAGGIVLGLGPLRAQSLPAPPLPLVTGKGAGGTTIRVSGAFVSRDGHLVIPSPQEAAEWEVEFGDERYSADVNDIKLLRGCGVALVKITVPRPVSPLLLSTEQALRNTRLRLVGVDADGKPAEQEAQVLAIPTAVPALGIDGEAYELSLPNDLVQPGAVLLDRSSGKVWGLLLRGRDAEGHAYALLSTTLRRQVAPHVALPVAGTDARESRRAENDRGQGISLPTRQIEFQRAVVDPKIEILRAQRDWALHTGFAVDALTPPDLQGEYLSFGGLHRRIYCVDSRSFQVRWAEDTNSAVVFPPSLGTDSVCVASGSLGLRAWMERDPTLLRYFGTEVFKRKRMLVDQGWIECRDRATGVLQWSRDTRFCTRPRIAGDQVLYGGLNVFGALSAKNGDPIWQAPESWNNRQDTTPNLYHVISADEQSLWVLRVPAKLEGDGTSQSPLRLEQNGSVRVECYAYREGKPGRPPKQLWSEDAASSETAPAFAAAAILSPDRKTVYGAAGRRVFAMDAQSGKRQWELQEVIRDHRWVFGGGISFSDSVLFVTSNNYQLTAVNPLTGKTLWTFTALGPLGAPFVTANRVYVGSRDSWLYVLDADSGQLRWKLQVRGTLCGQPQVLGRKLYCTTNEGALLEVTLPD